MSRTLLAWIAIGAIAGGTALTAASAWKTSTTRHDERDPVLFVCRETGALFLTRDPAVPQIHPDTGRATLWPGLYCPHCESWKPSPPMDRLYGKPEMLNCPKCRTPRSFDGEIPETAQEL